MRTSWSEPGCQPLPAPHDAVANRSARGARGARLWGVTLALALLAGPAARAEAAATDADVAWEAAPPPVDPSDLGAPPPKAAAREDEPTREDPLADTRAPDAVAGARPDERAAGADARCARPDTRAPPLPAGLAGSAAAGTGPDDTTPLADRGAAELAFAACLATARPEADDTRLRDCLETLRGAYPATPAAWRAEGALAALRALRPEPEPEGGAFSFPPGRLELSSTAGLFGIWNGITAGIITAIHLPSLSPTIAILGTGALSLGLGVAFGVGGYTLAERFDLSEGDSRLITAGLLWGTVMGIAATPILAERNLPERFNVSVPLLGVVMGGYLGGAASLLVGTRADITPAQVSLLNTGGWVGALFGLLMIPNLEAYRVQQATPYALTFLSAQALGLGAGALASRWLDASWGETLLLDLGGVLGLVASGTLMFTLNAAGAFVSAPGTLLLPLTTGSLMAGTLGGIGVAAAAVSGRRGSERPFFRGLRALGGPGTLEPTLAAPSVVLDIARQPVLVMGGPAFRF